MVEVPYGRDYAAEPSWVGPDGEVFGDGPSPLAEMVNGVWLDAQEFPALEYAVPGLIPEGFGLLVGPPKAGKSWLVADIGLAIASGGLALGRIPVTRRKVLYLALEDGHRRLQSRFRRITANQPIPEGMNVIVRAQPLEVLPMIEQFLDLYRDNAPLVILDTLGKVKPPRRAGEDPYAQDYAIGTRLKAVVDAVRGAALLVVHHSRKAESADFVDAVSGTHGIAGSADFVIVLSRKRHSDDAVLSVTGRDICESEYAVTTKDGLWSLDGIDLAGAARAVQSRRQDGQLGDRSLEVLALVNQRSETRAADLATIGINPEQGRVYLYRLVDSGRIRKTGRGIYGPLADPALLELPADTDTVITVTSVTSAESPQVKRRGVSRRNVTPSKASVTSDDPPDGNVTVITDITPN